jgi:hypothetical protein
MTKSLLVSKVVVTRWLTPQGDMVDRLRAKDADGEDLPLVEVLGMLRLAEDTAIRDSMGESYD